MSERSWPHKCWHERYLDHPLIGRLSRRLIWEIDGVPVAWTAGAMVNVHDRRVTPKKSARVRLWHPTMSKPAEVLAWRQWLTKHEVVQPFKQAHREIYLLTDAERRTQVYSNRFAGHVLKQHQFGALCHQRGWTYRMQGGFDSGSNGAALDLPEYKLTAEFLTHGVEGETSPMGIFLYLTTDQVRFGQALATVPTIVFSEVMRDVDLFVAVAGVASDPTWQDGGPNGRFRDYWQKVSFGDLTESARTRRAALEQLVPRLKIANRCALGERFLVVRGDLRTYRIHLGSGNILMEPNDEYLCIVPDRRPKALPGELLLPFEGDSTLSIVLSKAFLLAADKKITDPTITRQIAAK